MLAVDCLEDEKKRDHTTDDSICWNTCHWSNRKESIYMDTCIHNACIHMFKCWAWCLCTKCAIPGEARRGHAWDWSCEQPRGCSEYNPLPQKLVLWHSEPLLEPWESLIYRMELERKHIVFACHRSKCPVYILLVLQLLTSSKVSC